MPSPGRSQGPLDPATKVLEMESLGVKVYTFNRTCISPVCCVKKFLPLCLVKLQTRQCATCAAAGIQCEALLGAESDQHGLQFCMGKFGCG